MYILLLTLLATLSLAKSSTNITLPPFIPQLPEPYQTALPHGIVINHCSIPGTIALTFDDGPYIYTAQVLDTLAHHGARATFFLNGRNRGHIDQFPDLVKRAHAEGHQLGSHTYVERNYFNPF
jgi:peptidoglycan/xylan/chitin deacetylase (PgdA/CDA1 family)